MKKIEAYQTKDGKKFLKKQEAKNHENRLRYKANAEKIKKYLYNLLGIEVLDNDEDGESAEEQFRDMLVTQSKSNLSGFIDEVADMGIGEMIDAIIDIATISDGALLKTAQYVREITFPNKNNPGKKK